ncbi:MAG: hypothetical protein ACHP65_04985 [Legionellales bacterium]
MKDLSKVLASLVVFITLGAGNASANQTTDLSPILPGSNLPFQVIIEKANFQLPVGNHSGLFGTYNGLWVLLAGSSMGIHGFGTDPFHGSAQNRQIYVINPATGQVLSRSLTDPGSGLNQQQIDSLATISPEGYQENHTLYMAGGYGIDSVSGSFGTKPFFTAINLPGIIKWVSEPNNVQNTVLNNIRQISNPVFQVTGGEMYRLGELTQLVFGQDFTGVYTSSSNGDYSEQVRQFKIRDSNNQLFVDVYNPRPFNKNSNYRRRDLNVVPVLLNNNNHLQYGLVAYAGVFTPADMGVWTVPVIINETGDPIMPDPSAPTTFKQGMNQYTCAVAGLYSRKYASMYNVFFGGISYGFYSGGVFQTDNEIPFINQVTTIQMDKNNNFTQYLMDEQYPLIPSTGVNPGNPLLFGAGAYFIPTNIQQYPNKVINLDNIRKPTVIGYIVGGIQSTVTNTNTEADSSASTYVFKVTLIPK